MGNFGEARVPERKITYIDGKELAMSFQIPFFEMSCAPAAVRSEIASDPRASRSKPATDWDQFLVIQVS